MLFLVSILGSRQLLADTTAVADTATTTISAADAAKAALQNQIEERNAKIKQLEAEISQYNQAVSAATSEAQTLKGTLNTLDLTQKKISTDLSLTQQKISRANLTIKQLGDGIQTAQDAIETNKTAITNLIKSSDTAENADVIATILSARSLTDLWNDIQDMHQVQSQIKHKSDDLKALKADLESKQTALGGQKKQLVNLSQDLAGQKQAVESTKQSKAMLLAQTQNKEQAYKNLIKDRQTQIAQFEKEMFDFESQLNLTVDTGKYPEPQNGILSWPLDNVTITQKFGKTVGAEKLYVSGSHNGVDFRASIGTRVKNVLDGTVVGTGNTDAYPGCYSFGKWVMVKHDNGLSTIYGHLSAISVATGQQLDTGDLIGYSGNTGYSTGPHLHISVYATQGVRIEKYVNSRGCKQAIIPLADIKAYLDPLAYFPKI
jgi:murein DD-endopeptidase MepM/ murein hydrolase activator NlpD